MFQQREQEVGRRGVFLFVVVSSQENVRPLSQHPFPLCILKLASIMTGPGEGVGG